MRAWGEEKGGGVRICGVKGSGAMRGYMVSVLALGLGITLAGVGGGCAAVGVAAYMLEPPKKSVAKYTPTTRPMAVVVENARQKGSAGLIRDQMSGFLVAELREHKVAEMIENHRVYDLRYADVKAFRAMSVDEIGRRVGADQVLYIDLVQADVADVTEGTMMRGSLIAMVRLVDSKSGEVLWPEASEEGFALVVETPLQTQMDRTNVEAMREGLARSAAGTIAKLFYTYNLPR